MKRTPGQWLISAAQATSQVQHLAETAGTAVSLPAADVLAIMDKSLPTALGLAGISFPCSDLLRLKP